MVLAAERVRMWPVQRINHKAMEDRIVSGDSHLCVQPPTALLLCSKPDSDVFRRHARVKPGGSICRIHVGLQRSRQVGALDISDSRDLHTEFRVTLLSCGAFSVNDLQSRATTRLRKTKTKHKSAAPQDALAQYVALRLILPGLFSQYK
jgi:hypothetical protein